MELHSIQTKIAEFTAVVAESPYIRFRSVFFFFILTTHKRKREREAMK